MSTGKLCTLLAAAALLCSSATSVAEEQAAAAPWQPPAMPEAAKFADVNIDEETARQLEEKWGVRLVGMRLAATGYMMDFRFHVVDVEKALPLFDHRIRPYVIADKSHIKLPVPMAVKVGALRPTNRGQNIKAGKNYDMIFGNPDRHVKAGETVTVVIGDFLVESLVVS